MDAAARAALGLTLLVLGACAPVQRRPIVKNIEDLTSVERTKELERLYQAAVKEDPSFVQGWVGLGNIAFRAGDYRKAEERFKRALQLSPRDAGAANNLAMTYLMRGHKLDEAERLARGALERDATLRPYVEDTLAQIARRRTRED